MSHLTLLKLDYANFSLIDLANKVPTDLAVPCQFPSYPIRSDAVG